jgi:hypothetical protein
MNNESYNLLDLQELLEYDSVKKALTNFFTSESWLVYLSLTEINLHVYKIKKQLDELNNQGLQIEELIKRIKKHLGS